MARNKRRRKINSDTNNKINFIRNQNEKMGILQGLKSYISLLFNYMYV